MSSEARRTKRPNAGLPFERYQAGNSSTRRRKSLDIRRVGLEDTFNMDLEESDPFPPPSTSQTTRSVCGSNKSNSSSMSSKTLRKMTEAQLEARLKLPAQEESHDQIEEEMDRLHLQIKWDGEKIDELEEVLATKDQSTEEAIVTADSIKNLRDRIKSAEQELDVKSIAQRYSSKKLARLKAQVADETVLQQKKLQEDGSDSDDSQKVDDEGSDADENQQTVIQTEEPNGQQDHGNLTSDLFKFSDDLTKVTGPIIVSQRGDPDESDASLLARLRMLQGEGNAIHKNTRISKTVKPHRKSPKKGSKKETQVLEKLATTMMEAFKSMQVSGPSTVSEKFLSRQTMKQDLPPFDGNVEEWPIFITQYESYTRACGLSNVENLQRLQKCLRGKARETVRALLVSPDNVPNIIRLLTERFGKPTVILESLIMHTRTISKIADGNHGALLSFIDSVRNLTATAKSLSCLPYLNNPSLLQELVEKLPCNFQLQWSDHLEDKHITYPDIPDLAVWLEKIGTKVSRIFMNHTSDSQHKAEREQKQWIAIPNQDQLKKPEVNRNQNRRKDDRVHAAAEEGKKENKPERSKKCFFCQDGDHRLVKCEKFLAASVDERWKFIKSSRRCFACLNYGHAVKDCKSKRKCVEDGCDSSHNQLLHKKVKPEEAVVSHVMPKKSVSEARQVNLMILPVKLKGPKGTISTFAMLDCGSTITLLEQGLADKLGIKGEIKPLRFSGLHPTKTEELSQVVNFEIMESSEEKSFYLENVRTINRLPLPYQSVRSKLIRKWPHLQDINLESYEGAQPSILIGCDNGNLLLHHEVRQGPPNAPFAAKTVLGWVLAGRLDSSSSSETCLFIDEKQDALHQLLKDQFAVDAIGVKVNLSSPRSIEDQRGQEIMDATITKVGERFEAGLLWKDDDFELPYSRGYAMKRLLQMEQKMDRNPEFAEKYLQKIQEYQDKGFARKMTAVESKIVNKKTFYLPHFMAYNPKKPKKLRFVFDAAAKVQGKSLNDFLLKGPDQVSSLPSVLLKFRQNQIGITGDIKDMFHRVIVRKEDVDAQRFLWRGMVRDQEPDVMQMGVLIFGATCSPAIAQEVKNKNAKAHEKEFPLACREIVDCHYVDDYLGGGDSIEETISKIQQVTEVHRRGGFMLCNIICSSREVMQVIPSDLRTDGMKDVSGEKSYNIPVERVLGMYWKPMEDEFTFSLNYVRVDPDIMDRKRLPTKREALALVMSIYDPLGLLSHFTVKAKMILQRAWRSNIGWDEKIPILLSEKWNMWVEELRCIHSFRIPRCYSMQMTIARSLELHVFCDASEQAYGVVTYFRMDTPQGVQVSLVMAKARVAPLKNLSIPRLELQAAVLGSRLSVFIKEEHDVKVHRTVLWTDSRTVVCWLRSVDKKFPQFVSHRVGEIQEITQVADWKWIPTSENVADELTRDGKESIWSPESRWINGPAFLKLTEEYWPEEKVVLKEDEVLVEEKEFISTAFPRVTLIQPEDFSSWVKLLHTVAYGYRMVHFIQNKVAIKVKKHTQEQISTAVSVAEVTTAKIWVLKRSQQDSFPEEIRCLSTGKGVNKTSRIYQLSPFIHSDGLLRLQTRLQKAPQLDYSVKNPVILDPKHPVTRLLISYYHEIGGHHGMERALNEIRQQYHIINARTAVRGAWKRCQRCQNQSAMPVAPQMGQLPEVRLRDNINPFSSTGLDYFGPIEVKVKRSHEKRYGALFTCLSTRAVHIEIAHSLSTDSCIMAIRRFIGRRGCPADIWSDNGTNFIGANNELLKSIQELIQSKLTSECTNRGVNWHFIPPGAPHMGGSWERMVRSIKVALEACTLERFPTDEILGTLMVEAEHVVNSHPLTHVSMDPEDEEALTPNHFLIGRSSNVQQFGQHGEEDMSLRKMWRKSQALADHFWRRWVREYLPTLRKRTKWHGPSEPIKVGDVVIEIDNNSPRNTWVKAVVTAIYPGQDGVVRVVDIRRANGSVVKRPVVKLCILNVRKDASGDEETSGEDKKPSTV